MVTVFTVKGHRLTSAQGRHPEDAAGEAGCLLRGSLFGQCGSTPGVLRARGARLSLGVGVSTWRAHVGDPNHSVPGPSGVKPTPHSPRPLTHHTVCTDYLAGLRSQSQRHSYRTSLGSDVASPGLGKSSTRGVGPPTCRGGPSLHRRRKACGGAEQERRRGVTQPLTGHLGTLMPLSGGVLGMAGVCPGHVV